LLTLALIKARARLAGGILENGEYGPRFIPRGLWSNAHARFICDNSIKELHFNAQLGYADAGGYEFLVDLDVPLVGVKFVDHNAVDLTSIHSHQLTIKSIDVSFSGKLIKAVEFETFPLLERLAILVKIPGMSSIFKCQGLRHLALSSYAGELAEREFSGVPQLKELFLSSVKLQGIEPLMTLTALESLSISSARGFSSLAGIGQLRQLRELKIESCKKLLCFPEIASLYNLRTLWLFDCGEIESISSLTNLPNLRRLDIIGNTVIRDGNLSGLKSLENLKTVCVVNHHHYHPQAREINS